MSKVLAGITAGYRNGKIIEDGKGILSGWDNKEPHFDIKTEPHTVIKDGKRIVRRPDGGIDEKNENLKD